MRLEGGCHCGNVRYEVNGQLISSALCHCSDCRKHVGAPVVAWAMFPKAAVSIVKGTTRTYASSEHGRRQFCLNCGTSLFYCNDQYLPGITDIQTATLDDPSLIPPRQHVQTAERIEWMKDTANLAEFERFPS